VSENFDFTAKLERLREIADKISAADIAVEEMMQLAEEGLKLYKECKVYLERYQHKLKIIIEEAENVAEVEANIEEFVKE